MRDSRISRTARHRDKPTKRFRPHLNGKRVICLDIPDEFEYMDPVLVRLLEAKVGSLFHENVMFETPTYIVLDLPSPVSGEVHAMRERYDPQIASLPVEITIAGSSGIGVLSTGQQPESVFAVIDSVGRRFLPFRTALVAISRFPNSSVFWLKPGDRAPFDALQSALIEAGLRFEPHPFAYNPHCTISARTRLSQDQERRLLSETFPADEFQLSRLSLYQAVDGRAALLRTFSFDT